MRSVGLDTISVGVTSRFHAKCVERGFLTSGRSACAWVGDHRAINRLIEMTAHRGRFGDVLAEGRPGSRRSWPGGAEAPLCRQGLEIAGHSARALKG